MIHSSDLFDGNQESPRDILPLYPVKGDPTREDLMSFLPWTRPEAWETFLDFCEYKGLRRHRSTWKAYQDNVVQSNFPESMPLDVQHERPRKRRRKKSIEEQDQPRLSARERRAVRISRDVESTSNIKVVVSRQYLLDVSVGQDPVSSSQERNTDPTTSNSRERVKKNDFISSGKFPNCHDTL
jgi:hypothetical protein